MRLFDRLSNERNELLIIASASPKLNLTTSPLRKFPPQLKLPARHQILADLGFLLRQHTAYIDIPNTRLHYLNNHLNVEIIAEPEKAPEGADLKRLTASILLDLQNAKYINTATVLWKFDA